MSILDHKEYVTPNLINAVIFYSGIYDNIKQAENEEESINKRIILEKLEQLLKKAYDEMISAFDNMVNKPIDQIIPNIDTSESTSSTIIKIYNYLKNNPKSTINAINKGILGFQSGQKHRVYKLLLQSHNLLFKETVIECPNSQKRSWSINPDYKGNIEEDYKC